MRGRTLALGLIVQVVACGGARPSSPSPPPPRPQATTTEPRGPYAVDAIPRATPLPSRGASATVIEPAAAPMVAAPAVRQVSARGDVTCAVLADKTLRCWGDNQFDVVGGAARENPKPVPVPTPAPVVQVAVGAVHACVRQEDNSLACWGSNYAGEIGLGKPTSPPGPGIPTPTLVPGVNAVTAVSANMHSCVLLADKTVMFWGDYDSGAGDPRPAGSAKPARVVGLRDVEEIADTGFGACARLSNGAVRCWYMVSPGLIPRGKDRVDPVSAPVRAAAALYASETGMCAITRAGKLTCWSSLNQRPTDPYPGIAKLADIAELAIGGSAACVRAKAGTVGCEEQDGTGSGTGKVAPVPGLANVTQIAAGRDHFCAIEQGRLLCWGSNTWGQLGDGTTKDRRTPAPVVW